MEQFAASNGIMTNGRCIALKSLFSLLISINTNCIVVWFSFVHGFLLVTVFNGFYCSDYRKKVTEYLCAGCFFLQTNFDFITSHFRRTFFIPFKRYVDMSLNSKRYFTSDRFSQSYGGLKFAIMVNLRQLSSDTFRAVNA